MRTLFKKRILTITTVVVTLLAGMSTLITSAQADSNLGTWIICQTDMGEALYNMGTTDLGAYMFRSKSTTATAESVNGINLNGLLAVGGYNVVKASEDILGRPLDTDEVPTMSSEEANNASKKYSAFERFGMSGLRWTNYTGEWKYYQVNACQKNDNVSKTNFGQFYDGRKEPKSTWSERGTSQDIRTIQLGFVDSVRLTASTNIANILFSLAKGVVTLTITFVGLSFSDVGDLIGLTDKGVGTGSSISIFNSLFTGVFIPLTTFIILLTGLYFLYTGIIKRQYRMVIQDVFKVILIFVLALIIAAKPEKWIAAPSNIATYGQALVVTAMGGSSGKGDLCTSDVKQITDSGTMENKEYEAIGENMKKAMGCRMWEEFLFKPWVRGQFGVNDYKELDGDKINNINKAWVGEPLVPLGGGEYANNWALFQLSTQTNAHSAIGDTNIPRYVSGMTADYWRVVDAMSNYDEENVIFTPEGGATEVDSDVIKSTTPIHVWDSWTGNESSGRTGIALSSSVFGVLGSLLPLYFGLLSSIYSLGLILLMSISPVFLLAGLHPGRGNQILMGWFGTLVSTMLKKVGVGILLVFSFSIVTASMDMIGELGYFKAMLTLGIFTAALWSNRQMLLNMIGQVEFGGAFNLTSGMNKVNNYAKERASNAGYLAAGATGAALAARKTGGDVGKAAFEGAMSQLNSQAYRSTIGRQAVNTYNSYGNEIGKRFSYANEDARRCIVCFRNLKGGDHVYVDEYGNLLCRMCGDESNDESLQEIYLKESKINVSSEEARQDAKRKSRAFGTENKSYTSHSDYSRHIKYEMGADNELTVDHNAAKNYAKNNIKALYEDIEFFIDNLTDNVDPIPPSIPEPIAQYTTLNDNNIAWEYIEKVHEDKESAKVGIEYLVHQYVEAWIMRWNENEGILISEEEQPQAQDKFMNEMEEVRNKVIEQLHNKIDEESDKEV